MKCYCGNENATKKLSSPLHDGFIPICSNVECKTRVINEIEEISFRDSHQGRSRNTYENSVKINTWSFILCVISLFLIGAYYVIKHFINC
jgi:hypothetical protein